MDKHTKSSYNSSMLNSRCSYRHFEVLFVYNLAKYNLYLWNFYIRYLFTNLKFKYVLGYSLVVLNDELGKNEINQEISQRKVSNVK